MGGRLKKSLAPRVAKRLRRHKRLRSAIYGTLERPRLAVYRSSKHIYVQVIDDVTGVVLTQASSLSKVLKLKKGYGLEAAKLVGAEVAKRAATKKIKQVVCDVGGFRYLGRVKALADAARKGGLKF